MAREHSGSTRNLPQAQHLRTRSSSAVLASLCCAVLCAFAITTHRFAVAWLLLGQIPPLYVQFSCSQRAVLVYTDLWRMKSASEAARRMAAWAGLVNSAVVGQVLCTHLQVSHIHSFSPARQGKAACHRGQPAIAPHPSPPCLRRPAPHAFVVRHISHTSFCSWPAKTYIPIPHSTASAISGSRLPSRLQHSLVDDSQCQITQRRCMSCLAACMVRARS